MGEIIVQFDSGALLWSFGRHGVCAGLKIQRTRFESARLRTTHVKKKMEDLLAQLVEHYTFNVGVTGSNPVGVTNHTLMASHWLMDKRLSSSKIN